MFRITSYPMFGSALGYGTILALALGTISPQAMGQCTGRWLPPFGQGGPNGVVNAIIVWDPDNGGPRPSELVIGGSFTSVGGVSANRVAAWDGVSWHALGGGTSGSASGPVRALAVYNGNLIVGGTFDSVAGLPDSEVASIAAWDGERWIGIPPLSGAFNRPDVYDMVVHNGELIVGGELDGAGTVAVGNVAAWNGTSWRAMGALGNSANVVRALEVYQGSLYAGGEFDGGYRHIARWDGSMWQPVGGGIDDSEWVADLQVYDGLLAAGGQFYTVSPPVRDLVFWDGSGWSSLPQGVCGTTARVESLAVFNGDLVVGGEFTCAGPVETSAVARWTGTQWRGIDGGLTDCTSSGCRPTVNQFAVYNGELIAAGDFVTAGGTGGGDGVVSPHLARWTDTGVPWISRFPQPAVYDADDTATVSVVVATGYDFAGPLTYRWERNGEAVVDGPGGASPNGGTVAGATTATVTISGIRFGDSGQFTVRVANPCGTVTSPGVLIRVRCAGDFNTDGFADSQDLFDFLSGFFGLQPTADFNHDGFINSQDFFDFLSAFLAGC